MSSHISSGGKFFSISTLSLCRLFNSNLNPLGPQPSVYSPSGRIKTPSGRAGKVNDPSGMGCYNIPIFSTLSDEPAPVIACSNVRYLEWLSATRGSQGGGSSGRDGGGRGEVSWRSLGLWSEVECTTEFVDRMR